MLFCEPFANVLRNLLFCVAKLTVLPLKPIVLACKTTGFAGRQANRWNPTPYEWRYKAVILCEILLAGRVIQP